MKHASALPLLCVLFTLPLGCGQGSGTMAPPGAAGSSDAGTTPVGGATGGLGSAAGQPGSGGADGAPRGCDAPDLDDVRVYSGTGWDPLGYPPYALDDCSLVYVAPEQDGGALRLRDLASGTDIVLEQAEWRPRRPAVSGAVIAWQVGDDDRSQVRMRYQGRTRTLSSEFARAGEPRVCADAVVFTAFLGEEPSSDSDVYLYDVVSDKLVPIAPGPGQQRFADVSPTRVAFTDFSEDAAGYFDEMQSISDVVVVDRESGEIVSRKAPGKQAFPLLASDGTVVYLDWGSVHPEPKLSQFWLKAGYPGEPVELDIDLNGEKITTQPAYVRPSVHGVEVDFVDVRTSGIGLYRVSLTDLSAPVATLVPGAARLLGPVAAVALTLVSQPVPDRTLSLVAVQR